MTVWQDFMVCIAGVPLVLVAVAFGAWDRRATRRFYARRGLPLPKAWR